MVKIIPVIGDEYLIHRSDLFEETMKGLYLGMKPVITPYNLESPGVEGHLFLVKGKDDCAEVYNNITNDVAIDYFYFSDGEDGPTWDAGFSVSQLSMNKFSNLEKEVLNNRIKMWKQIEEKIKK